MKKLVTIFLVSMALIVGTYFYNQALVLYPVRYLESLGGFVVPSEKECNSISYAHGGFSNEGEFSSNSAAGIQAAISRGIRNIEIDLAVTKEGIWLQSNSNQKMSLKDFISAYASRFDFIIYDFKKFTGEPDRLLENYKFDPKKHFFIGRTCHKIKILQERTGVPSGCEQYGPLASWLGGFQVWSARYTEISRIHLFVQSKIQLKKIFWTYPNHEELKKACSLMPDIAIIEQW